MDGDFEHSPAPAAPSSAKEEPIDNVTHKLDQLSMATSPSNGGGGDHRDSNKLVTTQPTEKSNESAADQHQSKPRMSYPGRSVSVFVSLTFNVQLISPTHP
uniref:CTNNB1_binding domain-containing protein n=1 Tax=Macrostomum lignano TaxID=282301 RepID=A0A1I8G161_9PLAT